MPDNYTPGGVVSLPTLDDFKLHLNVSTTRDDLELSDVLDAAVDVVEGVVGSLRSATVTETHYGLNSDVLLLRRTPVTALTAISSRAYVGWEMVSQSIGDYELDAGAGLVRVLWGGRFYGDVTVTYATGRESLPAAIRLATLIIGKQMWETQRGAQPLPLQAQEATDGATDLPLYIQGIPDRARVLLEPFARNQQIA